jgi:hypothetical protein
MRHWLSAFRTASVFAFCALLLSGGSGLLQAAESSFRVSSERASLLGVLAPDWLNREPARQAPNESYLRNRTLGVDTRNEGELLEAQESAELRQRYNDLFRTFEQRSQYGLATLEEERSHHQQVRSFSQGVVAQVQRKEFQKRARRMRVAAENEPSLQAIRRPMTYLMAGVGIYYGYPVSLHLGQDIAMTARAFGPRQQGLLNVSTPIVNSSLEFNFAPLSLEEERRQPFLEPSQRVERMRFGLNRGISDLGIYTGLMYGRSSQTVSASVAKELSESWKLVMDSSRPIESGRFGEESLRLVYGQRF